MKKPICSRCKRPLSDPYSIAVGMGPECRGGARKKGVKFPKAKWRVSGGKTYFMGVDGKVEEPPNAKEEGRRIKDEKREIVLKIKQSGGRALDAVAMLHDYMREKDSPVTMRWCQAFVLKIWKEEA